MTCDVGPDRKPPSESCQDSQEDGADTRRTFDGLVSSKRTSSRPLYISLKCWLSSAALACPTCMYPEGSGGNRVTIFPSAASGSLMSKDPVSAAVVRDCYHIQHQQQHPQGVLFVQVQQYQYQHHSSKFHSALLSSIRRASNTSSTLRMPVHPHVAICCRWFWTGCWRGPDRVWVWSSDSTEP